MIPAGREGFEAVIDASIPFDPSLLERIRPDLVVNTVAISSVRACARDPSAAFAVNTAWPAGVAAACRACGACFIHFSTDLVHSGGTPPYSEDSPAVPRSVYGWTKLLGERAVLSAFPETLVIRTSVLFGEAGSVRPTFSEELLGGAVESVWVDSYRNHTPIHWLARVSLEAAASGATGRLVLAGRHSLSRSAFAEMLIAHVGTGTPPRGGYRPAGVPGDLSLDPGRAVRLLGAEMPDPFQSFEMEYPGGQSSRRTSLRNAPV